MTPTKAPRKKAGAPKGNQNARTHGLYARKFIDANSLSLEQKKAMLDACIARLFERSKTLSDLEDLCKCINSLAIAVTASNNCERTLAIVSGKYTPIDEILNALKYIDPEED